MRRIAQIIVRHLGSAWRHLPFARLAFARLFIMALILLAHSFSLGFSPHSSLYGQQSRGRGKKAQTNPPCCIRPQDQIWLISTRGLSDGGCEGMGDGAPALRYCRYDRCCGWVASTPQAFFGSQDPALVTTVYVHGNRITTDWALDHGFTTYCRLTDCSCDQRPIRHVIWSWPSDPIRCGARVIRDARVKAERTTVESYYLGWWLARMTPDQRISLLGFSYGGRTILGALHLVAGGELCGFHLGGCEAVRVRPRIALWACASESCWVCPGGCHAMALEQIDRGVAIFNPCDPALKRYQRLIPGAISPAIGVTGVPCCGDPENKMCQINAKAIIGKVHRFKPYMENRFLVNKIRAYALWPDTMGCANEIAAKSIGDKDSDVATEDLDPGQTRIQPRFFTSLSLPSE